MTLLLVSLLNGIGYGLMLFMLSAGFTLIFSMMGVLNFAHASFYMLGAYLGFTLTGILGFWPALLAAPLLAGALGALFERLVLRRVHAFGHVPELLVTFGLSTVLLELVQLVWGRSALDFQPPAMLRGPAFTLVDHAQEGLSLVWGAAPPALCRAADPALAVACTPFPLTRIFLMAVALAMLLGLWVVLRHTRTGMVIQAAQTHPRMVESLGHNVPRILMVVFGAGTGLAALAGVVGGSTFVTEPGMAAAVGSIIFVVVVIGGMGSLPGAFLASLLVGLLQTGAVAFDRSLHELLQLLGWPLDAALRDHPLARLSAAQLAPVLPYLLLVLVLVLRPRGMFGPRQG